MKLFPGKKEKINTQLIIDLYEKYIDTVSKALEELRRCFPRCKEDEESIKELENPVHKYESDADDIRREIELLMYEGMLLPDSRGDILGLLESYDLIPNLSEKIMEYFALSDVYVPDELYNDYYELLEASKSCVELLNNAAKFLLKDLEKMKPFLDQIDDQESEVDKMERNLIRKVFSMETGLAQKLLLRDLASAIASLPDLAENTADRLLIIASKSKA